MSILTSLQPFFRSEWAKRFVDVCDVIRTTDKGTWNQTTGLYENPTTVTVHSALPCLWTRQSTTFQEETIRDQPATKAYRSVFTAITETDFQRDDKLTMTTATDPLALGDWQIIAVDIHAYANRRELVVQKIEKGGWPR